MKANLFSNLRPLDVLSAEAVIDALKGANFYVLYEADEHTDTNALAVHSKAKVRDLNETISTRLRQAGGLLEVLRFHPDFRRDVGDGVMEAVESASVLMTEAAGLHAVVAAAALGFVGSSKGGAA